LLTTGGQIAFICYEDATWHIATKLAAETTQVQVRLYSQRNNK